jgi:hypothetical protein
MTTLSDIARRSFYPEKMLVKRRDTDALRCKYRARMAAAIPGQSRLHMLFDRGLLSVANSSEDLEVYESLKYIGSLVVSGDERMEATGQDGEHCIRRGRADATLLHLEKIDGPHALRSDFAKVSRYIKANQYLCDRPYVAGLTYREVGRLATTLGFKRMEITNMGEEAELCLRAAYQTFCAYNNVERPFEPAMMYLPTEQFHETFPAPDSVTGANEMDQ